MTIGFLLLYFSYGVTSLITLIESLCKIFEMHGTVTPKFIIQAFNIQHVLRFSKTLTTLIEALFKIFEIHGTLTPKFIIQAFNIQHVPSLSNKVLLIYSTTPFLYGV